MKKSNELPKRKLWRSIMLASLAFALVLGLCGFTTAKAAAGASAPPDEIVATASDAGVGVVVGGPTYSPVTIQTTTPMTFRNPAVNNITKPYAREFSVNFDTEEVSSFKFTINDVVYNFGFEYADSLSYVTSAQSYIGQVRYSYAYLKTSANRTWTTDFDVFIPNGIAGAGETLPVTGAKSVYIQSNTNLDSLIVEKITGYAYSMPETPTRNGYTFAGWYYDETLTQPYTSGDTITGDTLFYAKWTLNTYTVTYVGYNSARETRTVNHGIAAENVTPAQVEGRTFAGWYSDANCTTIYDFSSSAITSDTLLYAKYEVIMCAVTFYVEGQVYCTVSLPYGAVLIENGEATAAAAEVLSTLDIEKLVAAYGANLRITEDTEFTATVESSIIGWNKFGMWMGANWYWLLIGAGGAVALFFLIRFLWKTL